MLQEKLAGKWGPANAGAETITAELMQVRGHNVPQPIISALAIACVENSAINDLFSAGKSTPAFPSLIANTDKVIRFFFSPALAANLQCEYSLMDQISVLAAAGMQARMQSLDLLANNLANTSTGGYKSDGEFYTLFTSEAAGEDESGALGADDPAAWTDFGQGLLEPTNNPLDFGLSGKGFFAVQGPSGRSIRATEVFAFRAAER